MQALTALADILGKPFSRGIWLFKSHFWSLYGLLNGERWSLWCGFLHKQKKRTTEHLTATKGMWARVEALQNILSKSKWGGMERRNARGCPESKHHPHYPTEQATKTVKASLKKMKPFLCVVELGMWSFTSHLRATVEPHCCEWNCKKKKGCESTAETWDPDPNVYWKEHFLLCLHSFFTGITKHKDKWKTQLLQASLSSQFC